jgi:hypothetical protein
LEDVESVEIVALDQHMRRWRRTGTGNVERRHMLEHRDFVDEELFDRFGDVLPNESEAAVALELAESITESLVLDEERLFFAGGARRAAGGSTFHDLDHALGRSTRPCGLAGLGFGAAQLIA